MTPKPAGPRQTHRWRQLVRKRLTIAAANDEQCALCGHPIDYTLPRQSRYGATVDHTQPIALDGDPYPALSELGPAHRICQGRQGAAISNARQGLGKGSRGGQSGSEAEAKHATPTRRLTIVKPPRSTTDYANPTHNMQTEDTHMRIPNSLSPKPPTPTAGKNMLPGGGFMHKGYAGGVHNMQGGAYSPPRVMSERHGKAVGSFADEWIPWIEVADDGPHIRLREWQKVVLARALEYDAGGRLCWRDVVVSTPRQSGKGFLLWALAAARCHFSGQFGEPQELVHVANNLSAARRIHMRAWRWAAEQDIEIRKAFGAERLIFPDTSHWSLCAVPAIWGWSASVALLDECWDIPPEVATEAILPTLVEREQPQMWLFSTANSGATRLMGDFRGRALGGAPRVMIAEWSAPPDGDVDDPVVWRAASPYWSEQREELVAATPRAGRREQWLNQWPGEKGDGGGWLPGWGLCSRVVGPPPAGAVGALEVAADRSCFGVAVAWRDGDRVCVVSRVVGSLRSGLEVLAGWQPGVVLAGASLVSQVVGEWEVRPAGLKESRVATPWLADAVRRGVVVHDHDPATAAEFGLSRTALVESGELVSAKRSRGPIPSVKAVMWAAVAAGEDWFAVDSAVIW